MEHLITLEGNEQERKLIRALEMMRGDKEWFLYVRGYPEFRIVARNASEALKAKTEFKKLHGLKVMPSGSILQDYQRSVK
jgi:hypothetical protein